MIADKEENMDIIVAVDADWGIGKDGDLLQRISADMKYFREKRREMCL